MTMISIAENLFGRENHHAAEFREGIHVEILDLAEDAVMVFAVLHLLLLELHNIVEGERRELFERFLLLPSSDGARPMS